MNIVSLVNMALLLACLNAICSIPEILELLCEMAFH